MNFYGYVGHVTIVSQMLTTAFTSACCVLVGLGLGLGLDLVSGWLVVLHTYSYYFPLSLSLSLNKQVVFEQIYMRCIHVTELSTEPRRHVGGTFDVN